MNENESWTEGLASERLTDATLDRLTYRCHIPETLGESHPLKDVKRRRKQSKKKDQNMTGEKKEANDKKLLSSTLNNRSEFSRQIGYTVRHICSLAGHYAFQPPFTRVIIRQAEEASARTAILNL